MGSTSRGVTLRRILLLTWKNLIFRKRHYVVTALEIILPTIFAILMAYLKAEIGGGNFDENSSGTLCKETITTFPEFTEKDLIDYAYGDICYLMIPNATITVPYAPATAVTNEIMKNLSMSLKTHANANRCLPLIDIVLKPFDTEKDVENYNFQIESESWETRLGFLFAVIFSQGYENIDNDVHKVAYKLRFVNLRINTDEIMPWFPTPGPDWRGPDRYRQSGFAGVQILLDKIIMSHLTNQEPDFNMSIQAFPYPPYCDFDFTNLYSNLLPQFLVQGFIFMVPSILRGVVSEKETGIKELMKMMGLPNWLHWVGWMINSLIVLIFSVTIVVLLFFIPFNSDAGAVIEYSDPTVLWVVLFLYVIAASSACFFVSAFFQKPTLATTVGVVLWLVSYYALSLPLEPNYQSLNLATKLVISILPNMGLYYSIKIMSGYEGQGVGLQWNNIGRNVSTLDSLCLWHTCLMFIVSTIFYISLTIYFENILPSKYGLRKPWYYIFQKSEWGCTSKKDETDVSPSGLNDLTANKPGFEEEPSDLKIGIQVSNLRKVFGKKVAVDDVTMKMYDGQITALLGHNGAGKTTTMSILTGMYSATSGTAFVNGFDIKNEMDKVRENLGLCPQHNMLFNKLTVEEHLKFFGLLKGLTIKAAGEETLEIMTKLQLTDKKHTLSVSLSGGQKRKLCLGCALIGGTKVVILDEPTSGMDIESRRALWDILLEMRGHRTILLTTHFLEEADCLGDRIAIMADGKLQCCGSPMFLKKFYGTGYSLKMVTSSDSSTSRILTTIQRHIESAELKMQNGPELTFTIPAEGHVQSSYPALFSELNATKHDLGIQTIGLSLTTMDEVFVKVGELHHLKKTESHASGLNDTESWGSRDNLQDGRIEGVGLITQQFYALFLKKFTYTFRKRRLFISQFVFPVLLVIAAILISNSVLTPRKERPPLTIQLADYKDSITLYSTDPDSEDIGDIYASVVGPSAKLASNVSQSLLDIATKDIGLFRERYIIAAEMNSENIKAMLSTIPLHATPLSINLLSNTMLKNLDQEKQYSIEVTNHPLKSGLQQLWDVANPNPQFVETIPILFAVFMPIGLALLAASYIVFPIEERQCKAKQVQLMTGTSPIIYWGASFVWDFLFMIILICFMTACFPIFEEYQAFTNNGGAGVAFLILFVYGFEAISFSYLLSLLMSSVPGGFTLVTILHILTGMIVNLVVYGLHTSDKKEIANIIAWFGRLFPTYGAATTTMSFTKTSAINSKCNIIKEDYQDIVCSPEISIIPGARLLQQCCDNCKTLTGYCFEPEPYIKWYDYVDDQMGIAPELMCMFIMALVYKFILIAIEYGLFRKLQNALFQAENLQFFRFSNDEDVKAEAERVRTLITSGRVFEDAIVVDNICKSFGVFSAVSKLTFGVHYGECFGLLGVNGAGKTTTFRMLTGDEIVSDGNAYAMMKTLKDNHKDFLSKIGYCPQFDGIIGVLTGREMLELFSRLRGIPRKHVKAEANKWLTKLGLMENADIQCEKYSGGMKRRLSAAMAMVGDPPVLMLDEPTTGVDPVARRELWASIASSKRAGQAIILTSHSMEECEALCSRLGIMVNGELQCIGGVEHLKSKFAQGFCLTIKLKFLQVTDDRRLNSLHDQITKIFNPCTLKDQHQNILQYQIYNTALAWDMLFETMEKLKSNFVDYIEEYSVSQTTLEEVFLSFARLQYPERRADVSLLRRIITCQCCNRK